MPELPHVAGFKDYADATAVGRTVRHTHVRDPRVLEQDPPRSLAAGLTGHRITAARRHGKFLGLALDDAGRDGVHLVLHFAMTGRLTAYDDPADEPKHTGLVLDLDDGRHLAFSCARRLCRARLAPSFEAFVEEKGLGPDALDPDLDADWFVERLERKRGGLKNALMDQSVLCGIGNEYADEILFHMALHPAVALDRLDPGDRRRLWETLRRVLATAAEAGGELERLPRGWLSRSREEGRCERCGAALERARLGGRSAWYCPRCQPEDD